MRVELAGGSLVVERYVIVYDIADDRRRDKIYRVLKDFAVPVQFSVFEGYFTDEALVSLRYRLMKLMRRKEDNIIFYPQCQRCLKRITRLGNSIDPFESPIRII